MKTCSHCKLEKEENSFWKDSSKKDGLTPHCKVCGKEYFNKTYYKDSKLKDSILKKNKERQLKVRQYVFDYLKSHPCDCGESDPIVLEFDHIEKENKKCAVATLIANKYSLKAVQEEIQKCVVRCANCHRRKTAKDFDWYKGLT